MFILFVFDHVRLFLIRFFPPFRSVNSLRNSIDEYMEIKFLFVSRLLICCWDVVVCDNDGGINKRNRNDDWPTLSPSF